MSSWLSPSNSLVVRSTPPSMRAFIEIILRFVDIDEGCSPPFCGNRCPFLGGLGKERNEEAPQNLAPLLLEQILGRVDEYQAPAVEGRKHIQPVLLMGEHPREHAV